MRELSLAFQIDMPHGLVGIRLSTSHVCDLLSQVAASARIGTRIAFKARGIRVVFP